MWLCAGGVAVITLLAWASFRFFSRATLIQVLEENGVRRPALHAKQYTLPEEAARFVRLSNIAVIVGGLTTIFCIIGAVTC
jgi:hypothetical protein